MNLIRSMARYRPIIHNQPLRHPLVLPPHSQVLKEGYPKAPDSMREVLQGFSELCYALQAVEKSETRARTSKKTDGSDTVGWKERALELAIQKTKGILGKVDSLLLRHCLRTYSQDSDERAPNVNDDGDDLPPVAQEVQLKRIETKLSEMVDWVGAVEKLYEKDSEKKWRFVDPEDGPSEDDDDALRNVSTGRERMIAHSQQQKRKESDLIPQFLVEKLNKIEARLVYLEFWMASRSTERKPKNKWHFQNSRVKRPQFSFGSPENTKPLWIGRKKEPSS